MLDRISIGWVWLNRTLNGIIDEINRQKPIGSTTVAIEESSNGTLFKAVGFPDNQPADSGAAAAAKPPAPVIWHNVAWLQVAVVDPATCARTTIAVLVQSPGNNITIQ